MSVPVCILLCKILAPKVGPYNDSAALVVQDRHARGTVHPPAEEAAA